MPVFRAPDSESEDEIDEEKWDEIPQDGPKEQDLSASRSMQREMELEAPSRDSAVWKRKWLNNDMAQAFEHDFSHVPLKRRKLQDRRDRFGNLNVYELSLPISDSANTHELKTPWVAEELRKVLSETALKSADYIEDVRVNRSESGGASVKFFLSIEITIDDDFRDMFLRKVRNHCHLYPLFFGAMSESESIGEGSMMMLLQEDPPPKELKRVRLKPRIQSKSKYRHGHFCASFGPNGQIIKCGRKDNQFVVNISQVTNGRIAIPADIHRTLTTECFDIHRIFHTQFEAGTLAQLCDRYSDLFNQYVEHDELSAKGRLQVRHISLAFQLLKILWEKPVSTYPRCENKYDQEFMRRINFDKWMRKVSQLDVENRLHQLPDGPEKIFWLLASNQKKLAIQHCWDIRNLRLASIISGCDKSRLRDQIRVWQAEKNWQTFPPGLQKCYLLLSGQFTPEVIRGMNWVQYLHIVATYGVHSNMSTSDIIKTFQSHLKTARINIPQPKFSFHGEARSIQFEIMCLYIREKNHLRVEPLTCTSSELDFVWLWHLQDALHSHGFGHFDTTELLYRSLIEQLERIGLWQYAAYAAICATRYKSLENFDVESTCKLLLNLNYPRTKQMLEVVENSDKMGIKGLYEAELAQDRPQWEVDFSELIQLGLKEEWIYSAIGILAMYEEDYETALEKFMQAKDYAQACDILCKYELPRMVLDGEYEEALSKLKVIEENKNSVRDYNTRAGIYQTYLQMNEQLGERTEKQQLDELRSIQDSLRQIDPLSDWEDALISKMIDWSKEVECNLMHSIGEEFQEDLKMQDLDASSRDRSGMSQFSQSSIASSRREKINPLLLEELVEMEVMDSYEI